MVRAKAGALGIKDDMLKRAVNVGFSGGEKKRYEILQMAMLEPSMAILDETDSGLDVDALKIVSEGVNALRGDNIGMLVITHYQRLLDHIVPDHVHILAGGKILKSGDKNLALEVEKQDIQGLSMLHDQLKSRLDEGHLLPLSANAAKRFIEGGFPKPQEEAWRFTNLNALRDRSFAAMPDAKLATADGLPEGARLVFFNGVMQDHLSTALPDGLTMVGLADDAELAGRLDDDRLSGHAIANLSVAMMTAGLGLRISGQVETPLHLVFRNDGADASSHAVIVVDIADHASCSLIEHHHGDGDGLSAPVLSITLGQSARLDHGRVQSEDGSRHHLAVMAMDIAEKGQYHALSVQTGSALSRRKTVLP